MNRLNEILIHELNHIYLFRTPNYHILPKWFVEGFASYWADELNITKKIQISSALWEKRQFGLGGLKINLKILMSYLNLKQRIHH